MFVVSNDLAMNVEIDISGLEELQRKLERLDGEHQVELSDLMPPAFVSAHTRFADVDSFLTAAGFEKEEDFETDAFNDFVKDNTSFGSWNEMQETAAAEWARRQLFG